MSAAAIKQRIMQMREIPSLPEVAARVVRVVDNPRTSAVDLAKVISLDPALTARVLRLANSALYGYSGRVGTVVQGVTVLGFTQVRSLVLTVSVLDVFSRMKSNQAFPHREFWEHCVGCAVAARLLARNSRLCPPEEAFVAGILHDVGKLVLAVVMPNDYTEVLQAAEQQQNTLAGTEATELGFTHATAAGWLAERWRLPRPLAQAVENHHDPRCIEFGGPAACTYAADLAMNERGIGWSGNARLRPGLNLLPAPLSLDDSAMEEFAKDFAQECAAAFEILERTPPAQRGSR